jgi:hypothetical protein
VKARGVTHDVTADRIAVKFEGAKLLHRQLLIVQLLAENPVTGSARWDIETDVGRMRRYAPTKGLEPMKTALAGMDRQL